MAASRARSRCRKLSRNAGLIGAIVGKHPLGSYHYEKQLSSNRGIQCEVTVYLLPVER